MRLMMTFFALNAACISRAINIVQWICKHTAVYGKSGNTTWEHRRRRGEMEIAIQIFLRRDDVYTWETFSTSTQTTATFVQV